ncbi:methyltransferase domain-containing protein [Penicillium verrucosum]|uniref:methyltransferase domain-containing protein n=1 Tax=Penicillium verrucosum TaxID=60171 RepID=UPI0025451D5E|nr:methyltransferase domain-containing protein [Penicillium verrucosum]KAJ5943791.1 methyltransferase domain-containing protein [Penicillium verrucosum]
MFRSISINLKSTGVFVGVCPYPTNDVASFATNSDPPPPTGVRFEYSQELENGLGYRKYIIVEPPPGSNSSAEGVDFWAYHLKKSVFEEAARLGGMGGKLEWRECEFLEEEWKLALGMGKNEEGWRNLCNNPQMSVLVLWKE